MSSSSALARALEVAAEMESTLEGHSIRETASEGVTGPPPCDLTYSSAASLERSMGSPMPELRQFLSMTSPSPREATNVFGVRRGPPPLPTDGSLSTVSVEARDTQPPPHGRDASATSPWQTVPQNRSAAAVLSRRAGALSRAAAVAWATRRWMRSSAASALVAWRSTARVTRDVRHAREQLERVVLAAWPALPLRAHAACTAHARAVPRPPP